MRKVFFTLVLVVSFLGCKSDSINECDCSQYVELSKGSDAKIVVCHNGNDLTISVNALDTHLNHGDSIGSCKTLSVEDLEYDECFYLCQDKF